MKRFSLSFPWRGFALCLGVLLLLPLFAACGNKNDPGTDTEPVEETVTDLEDVLGFEIPENELRSFTILYDREYGKADVYATEEDKDDVSAAVYKRNQTVEDIFNLELSLKEGPGNFYERADFQAWLYNAYMSGGETYDLVFGMSAGVSCYMFSGIYANLIDLEGSVDLRHDWWMSSMTENCVVNGELYGLLGDTCHSDYAYLGLIVCNKSLIDSFGVEDKYGKLYDMVYNQEWTVDKMLEIGRDYGRDVDGDGMVVGEDVFGLMTQNVPSRLFLFSCGLELITRNDKGTVSIPTALDQRIIDLYDKLYDVFQRGSEVNIGFEASYVKSNQYFSQNQVMMFTSYFMELGKPVIRDMNNDYVLLPMPKYDSLQEDYITPVATEAGMVLIPVTAVDIDFSAKVMEFYGYYGKKIITPVYRDNILSIRYAGNPENSKMVTFILDKSYYGLTQLLIWGCETPQFRNLFAFGSINIGGEGINTTYRGAYAGWQGELDKMFGAYSAT